MKEKKERKTFETVVSVPQTEENVLQNLLPIPRLNSTTKPQFKVIIWYRKLFLNQCCMDI
jgi:hypothetical protein